MVYKNNALICPKCWSDVTGTFCPQCGHQMREGEPQKMSEEQNRLNADKKVSNSLSTSSTGLTMKEPSEHFPSKSPDTNSSFIDNSDKPQPSYETKPLDEKEYKEIRSAANWILVLGIIFFISGTVYGWLISYAADEIKEQYASLPKEEVIELEGQSFTVDKLLKEIDREAKAIYITNYLLGIIMIILFFWARKNPFPAIVTAFAIYICVHVFNAIIDPDTIFQGIVIKIIVISVFSKGISMALHVRSYNKTL